MKTEYEIERFGDKHLMTPIAKERLKGNSKPKIQAFWIKNYSIINVPTLHIDVITSYPEKFGWTTERLQEVFEKYNEPFGHEGKARQEIMRELIEKEGWIRVRYTLRNDLWTLECNRLSKNVKNVIWSFFMLLTGHDIGDQKSIDNMNSFSEVKITELHNLMHNYTSVKEILNFSGLFENSKPIDVKSILIENYIKENNFEKCLNILRN